MRYFGAPQMLICDSGNEFKANFERGLELCGILQHVILPVRPWQNGRAGRHGGWNEVVQNEVPENTKHMVTIPT